MGYLLKNKIPQRNVFQSLALMVKLCVLRAKWEKGVRRSVHSAFSI